MLLLFKSSGSAQAGVRSLFAFWLGGISANDGIEPSGQPIMKRHGGIPGMRLNRGIW